MRLGMTPGSSALKFPTASYGKKGRKALIAYASRAGSTAEAAEIMGEALGEAGFIADVMNLKEVKDLSAYDIFILGTAVRAGKTMPEFEKFVSANLPVFNSKPVSIYLLCMTLSQDTPENRKKAAGYFASVKQKLKPAFEGYFAGRMDYSKLNFIARFAVEKMVKVPQGDFMKIEKIRKWVLEAAAIKAKI